MGLKKAKGLVSHVRYVVAVSAIAAIACCLNRKKALFLQSNKVMTDMAKELALKYGCNPNQKPARIYMQEGELPIEVLNNW